nr:hypothetical protein [Trueperella bernardiae]
MMRSRVRASATSVEFAAAPTRAPSIAASVAMAWTYQPRPAAMMV